MVMAPMQPEQWKDSLSNIFFLFNQFLRVLQYQGILQSSVTCVPISTPMQWSNEAAQNHIYPSQ